MSTIHDAVAEVGDQIYRIHTPVTEIPGGFSLNQYLLVDEGEALLFHTGPRALARRVIEAVDHVVGLDRLKFIGFSHVEADECGGLNALLAAAPNAVPVCSAVGAMVQVNDLSDRAPRPMHDGELLELGRRRFRWLDAPHVPHGWDNGYFFETTTETLLCGDLFTQGGTGNAPLADAEALKASEAFRQAFDYYAHAPHTVATLERLAALEPDLLACMHGSAHRGDGSALLGHLAQSLRAAAAER
jgi:flavorubredoxin